MKALTIWQPWATLAALGLKGYETRHWSTRYRGLLAIHAAVRRVEIDDISANGVSGALRTVGIIKADQFPLGAVLGIVRLVDVIEVEVILKEPRFRKSREYWLGNYEPGRFAWQLEVVRVFNTPIPCKGMQGLWEWNTSQTVDDILAGRVT